MAGEVIRQLDKAQDRALTCLERRLKERLGKRCIGLAAIERSRLRQRSRLAWIKHTKLFHLKANGRRRRT